MAESHIFKVPNMTKEYHHLNFLEGVIFVFILTSIIFWSVGIIFSPVGLQIRDVIAYFVAFLVGLLIILGVILLSMRFSKKWGEYGYNTIRVEEDKIIINRVFDEDDFKSPTVIEADKICDLRAYKGRSIFVAPYQFGLEFMEKKLWERYHSTFGLYTFVYCGIISRKEWKEWEKKFVPVMEEFKKRNNITGCKPKKGGKS